MLPTKQRKQISTTDHFNPIVISQMQCISSKLDAWDTHMPAPWDICLTVSLGCQMLLGSPHAVLSFPWSKQDKDFERAPWTSAPYTRLCHLLNSKRKHGQELTAIIWQLQCKSWSPGSGSASPRREHCCSLLPSRPVSHCSLSVLHSPANIIFLDYHCHGAPFLPSVR